MADKLVCDRCGFELTERDDIALALDGEDAWINGQRSRGVEARGVFPCKHYIRCQGEMVLVKYEKKRRRRGLFSGGTDQRSH